MRLSESFGLTAIKTLVLGFLVNSVSSITAKLFLTHLDPGTTYAIGALTVSLQLLIRPLCNSPSELGV